MTATPAETPLVMTARRAITGLPGTSSGVFASLTTGEAFADDPGMIIPAGAFIDLAIAGAAHERLASRRWRATDRAWLLNEIPASAAAAHVTMTLAGVRADGGYLVAGDHPYILVLFAQGADEATIERALAQASAAIYRAAGGR